MSRFYPNIRFAHEFYCYFQDIKYEIVKVLYFVYSLIYIICTAKRFPVQLHHPHAAKWQFSFVRPCAYCYTERQSFRRLI